MTVTVVAPGSGLVFQDSYDLDKTFESSHLTPAEIADYETDIDQAEEDLSSEFTNSVTINVDVEAVNVPPNADGFGFNLGNVASEFKEVTYATYLQGLQNVATSNYQKSAVAALEKLPDVSQNDNVLLPMAYARMLGLQNSGQTIPNTGTLPGTQAQISPTVDDTFYLNLNSQLGVQATLDSQPANTPNSSIVGAIEHELSEGGMGRMGFLNTVLTSNPPTYGPTDFFRVNAAGQSYLTPDLTGNTQTPVFFSPDPGVQNATVSTLEFNNNINDADFADWIQTQSSDPGLSDPFGPGDFSDTQHPLSSTLSQTDIDVLNVLGWTIASSGGGGTPPPLTIALKDDTGASSTDKLTSDPTLTGAAAPNATVTLSANGVALGTAAAGAGGDWTFTPTTLADGQHTITATESYGAGKTVTASLTFWLATQAPTVTATESVSGETNQTSDTIAGSAVAERVGADAITGVEIFDGNANLGPARLANGSWTFTAQNLLPGAHNFTARATDSAGNIGVFSLPQVVVTGSQPNNTYTLSGFSFTGDGVTDIRPKGINDSGEIVGYYLDGRADVPGPEGTASDEHGFYSKLSGGVRQYVSIDNPSSATATSLVQTRAFAVADNGDIVGWYQQQGDGIADDGTLYPLPTAGFIMSASWPGTFGTLGFTATGGFGTHALGVNSSDDIVGWYYDGSGEQHGFLREFTGYGVRGNYISFDPPNSVNTIAEGINDSGEIVGYYETSNGVYHGFTYNSVTGAYATIDVNGAADTEPLGINNSGEIVGEYIDSAGNTHGFVRSATGQFTTIDDPNAGSGGTLVSGINNAGEIVGWYTGTDGHSYGFTGVPAQGVVGGGSLSDIVLQNADGQPAIWIASGTNVVGGGTLNNPGPAWTAVGTGGFFTGDTSDILWQNTSTGQVSVWEMNGTTRIGGGAVSINPGSAWKAVGTGDFNGDHLSDILFQNTSTGQVSVWEMDGTTRTGGGAVSIDPGTSWKAVGTGDFTDDGFSDDILFQNASTGQLSIWEMDGNTRTGGGAVSINPGPAWRAIGTGDFYGAEDSDILFQNASTGQVAIWEMDGNQRTGGGAVSLNPGPAWRAIGTDNGGSDILFQNTSTGQTSIWEMDGTSRTGGGAVSVNAGPSWRAVALT